MITSRKGRNGRYVLLFMICIALIGYFSYHAAEGNHGLHRRTALQERQRIEHDVSLMTGRVQTDPDMLDEQARGLLNYVRPGDIVVLRPRNGEDR
jgi:cell division protein FtsB